MRLVLASTSPYRRELVARLGLGVVCVAPPFDEEAAKAELGPVPAEELVLRLARGKAESVRSAGEDALVIGSDSVAEIDGRVLGKPGTEEKAKAQLGLLSGTTHRLLTAVAVHHPASGRTEQLLDVHTLAMRRLGAPEIAEYVRRDLPLDCAGSYRVESLGIALFERISGDDFTAVIGLPLTKLVALLGRFGLEVLAPASG